MNKSVYSLILSDAVVAAVDAAAYAAGTNRSAMINRILAEYVSYVTPEQRVSDIFKSLCSLLEESGFRLFSPPSGTMLNIGSALSYKYNPSVRYRVELSHRGAAAEGRLKVSLRTTSASLLKTLEIFYSLWTNTERSFGVCADTQVENGRYSRALDLGAAKDGGGLSAAISAYITAFDRAMKGFFEAVSGPAQAPSSAPELVKAVYRGYLAAGLPEI